MIKAWNIYICLDSHQMPSIVKHPKRCLRHDPIVYCLTSTLLFPLFSQTLPLCWWHMKAPNMQQSQKHFLERCVWTLTPWMSSRWIGGPSKSVSQHSAGILLKTIFKKCIFFFICSLLRLAPKAFFYKLEEAVCFCRKDVKYMPIYPLPGHPWGSGLDPIDRIR